MRLTPKTIFDSVLRLKLQVNPLVLAAQTWHETGGYRHCCGSGNSNLAGIKSTRAWMDGTIPWSTMREVRLPTQEYDRVTAKSVTIQAGFRWYGDDYELCLRDIERIVTTKPWFADAARNNDCCWAYLAWLIARWTPGPNARILEPGWATGHKYFDAVAKLMVQFAPELLGNGWRERLTIALALAESREALSEDQARVIKDLLMPKSA